MALGGSFGAVGGSRPTDLGYTRFWGGPSTSNIRPAKNYKDPNQFIVRNEFAKTGIAGYNPVNIEPKVDLFKDNGGYAGLIGIKDPLKPGTYKLSELLGLPPIPQTPVIPQYSQEQATQNLVQQLAGLANNGQQGPVQAPLSPTNSGQNKKGPAN